MSAKRIRCECGCVYEPAKNPNCPSCGVAAVVAPVADKKDDGLTNRLATEDELVRPGAAPIAPTGRAIAIGGGIFLVLVALVFFLTRSRPHPVVTPNESTPAPSVSAAPSVVATATPQTFGVPQPFDLLAAISSASPGATIKVPPGFYQGGLVLTKPVRLIASGGQSWIQSDGRECLTVKSPGVFVQGMQFICNGIGELAAISIADGGELELDSCRIQSATALGLTSSNGSLTTTGATITASNGTALRLNGGKASLTQTTFSDSKLGLALAGGATVEMKSCAFERDGTGDGQGGIMFINGPVTKVTASDCQFVVNSGGVYVTTAGNFTVANSSFKENGANAKILYGTIAVDKSAVVSLTGSTFQRNRQGVAVGEGGTVEMDQCTFDGNGLQARQLIVQALPLSVMGNHASAKVRNSAFANSTPFAIGILNGGGGTFDNIEVSGTKDTGLAIGDDKTPPSHVEITRSHFHDNENGMAVFFGSTAKIDETEFRANNTSGLAAIKNAQLELHKVSFLSNGSEGLLVYGQSRAIASECQFIGNARGAQSGYAKRNAGGHASITVEDSEVGGNRVFGLGALSSNELIMRNVTFHGDDKVPVYKEKNAIVKVETAAAPQAEGEAEQSPLPDAAEGAAPNESPEASASPAKNSPSKKSSARNRPHPRRPEDDAARILRNIFGPH